MIVNRLIAPGGGVAPRSFLLCPGSQACKQAFPPRIVASPCDPNWSRKDGWVISAATPPHSLEQTKMRTVRDSVFVGSFVGAWVGLERPVIGTTGVAVGSTGAVVGSTGAGVGATGAMVGSTEAAMGFSFLDLDPFFLAALPDL